MNTTYHKFLILSAVLLLVGGVYVYFSNGLNASAATPVAPNSALSSTASKLPGASVNTIDSTDSKILQDTAFLATLTSLTKIRIDTSLFSKASFMALNDNTVVLEAATPGRPNPFALIDSTDGTTTSSGEQVSALVTNQASAITTKSAVLNASINTDVVATNLYFEYGPTPTLGKSTPLAKQSLIGTFATSITGLTSGTTYFFRAAAKLDGQVVYGEISSFSTN